MEYLRPRTVWAEAERQRGRGRRGSERYLQSGRLCLDCEGVCFSHLSVSTFPEGYSQ